MFYQWLCICMLILISVPLSAQDDRARAIRRDRDKMVSEQRVALVIGNAAYANIPPLQNPINDADSLEVALRTCGFTVLKYTDLNHKEIGNAVRAFRDSMEGGGVGLFYYSGHAWKAYYDNYLIPLNFKVDVTVTMRYQIHFHGGFNMSRVLEKMQEAGNRVNILLLDAGPWAVDLAADVPGWLQDAGPWAVDRLEGMNVPSGMFIAYTASPDQYTLDETGPDSNGLFTGTLMEVMSEPGLRIEEVFRKVLMKVKEDTARKQVLWDFSTLVEDFYFVLPLEDAPPQPSKTLWDILERRVDEISQKSSQSLEIRTNQGEYRLGEYLTITCNITMDGYINVLSVNRTDEEATVLYPRQDHSDNRVRAGTTITIPGLSDRFTLKAGKPLGEQLIVVFVSSESLNAYEMNGWLSHHFGLAPKGSIVKNSGVQGTWRAGKIIIRIVE